MIPSRPLPLCLVALVVLLKGVLNASAAQTQGFTLQPGWNAIWLDPSPVDAEGSPETPETVFSSDRITVVARPLLPAGSAEFVSDSTSVFNQEEWLVWYRNPQSLVNSLGTITGNQAYYVKVEGAGELALDVTGEVGFFAPDWVPNAYNLVGFNLSQAVSFGDFFGPQGDSTGNHPINAILRLDPATGSWISVTDNDLMQPGAAYWIKSVRNSAFMGPVSISFDGLDGLDFGSGTGDLTIDGSNLVLSSNELTFTNIDTIDMALSVTLVDPNPANELVVYEVVPGSEGLTHEIGPAGQIDVWNLGTLAAQTTRTVTMGAQRSWTTGDPVRENLYRIDVGPQYFWLPAEAENPDVAPDGTSTPDAASAGLWIGEIVLDAVSQVGGSEVQATTSSAPMRIILHADASGAVSLLSHVMFMQTKTADDSVLSEQVLVVDEDKIPFFEGIETRGGKRVGRRIETVAFDLPRDYDTTVQMELLEEVAAADDDIPDADSVTEEDIETFLDVQTSRPPDLVEEYLTSWPLTGSLGQGGTLTTTEPLTLDPFHRANPFRHAFHPQHGAGFAISRELSIVLHDTADPGNGFLSGFYTESISGLVKHPITIRGSITLTRLSTVTELQ